MPRHVAITLMLLSLTACGDDDGQPKDAGNDGALPDAGDGGGLIPRRDSSVVEGDPIPDCDVLDPLACGAGQKCDWVLRFATTTQAEIYTGCIDKQDERELGVPCEQWGRRYDALGLTQDAFVDPCVEGAFCAPDPELRAVSTCQPLCESGVTCAGASFCRGTPVGGGAAVSVCGPSDDCDGLAQAGCDEGDSCYLRSNGARDGALAVCLPYAQQAGVVGAHGDACLYDGAQYLNACQPGAVCWGSPRKQPSEWATSEVYCRSYCDPALSGDDSDGGTSPCGGGQCVSLSDASLDIDVSAITSVPGVCD